MRKMQIAVDAPLWAKHFREQIESASRRLETPNNPVRLPSFADSAALPPAANWTACQVFKADIAMVCVSDGTNWKRVDTGASV